jgi:crossover junction endodeoxyribonuclease RuvC
VGVIGEQAGNGCPRVFDTPTLTVEGEKTKRRYNTAAMAQILMSIDLTKGILVILENVHSMPKQGVASSFSFGQGLGMWQGIVAALGIPLEMPSPQRWKKEIMADQGRDKDAARFKAIQLFPTLATQLSRVKDDGRAEALLMAEYGRRLRK